MLSVHLYNKNGFSLNMFKLYAQLKGHFSGKSI